MSHGTRYRWKAGKPQGEVTVGVVSYGDNPYCFDQPQIFNFEESDWIHESFDDKHKGPPYEKGGPMRMYRRACSRQPWHHQDSYPIGVATYTGGFISVLNRDSSSDFYLPYNDELVSAPPLDVRGWNNLAPGGSSADVGQSLVELRDLARVMSPLASGIKAGLAAYATGNRAVGLAGAVSMGLNGSRVNASGYLGWQFGIKPLLNDLRKYKRAIKNASDRMDNLRRCNGKWVRRRTDAKTEIIHDNEVIFGPQQGSHVFPTISTSFYRYPYFTKTVTRTTKRTYWYCGQFRQYIPDNGLNDLSNELYRHMLGFKITPSLMWELMPWSWLLDWFGNFGDCVEATSRCLVDNLISRECYSMCTTTDTYVYKTVLHRRDGVDLTCTDFTSCVVKDRSRIQSIGIDISRTDLSVRQLSILGALGIARVRI